MIITPNCTFRISILLVFLNLVCICNADKFKIINLNPLKAEIKENLYPIPPMPSNTDSIFGFKFWTEFNKAFGITNKFRLKNNQTRQNLIEPSLDKMYLGWRNLKQKLNHLKGDVRDSATDVINKLKPKKVFNNADEMKSKKKPPECS
nr:uncharacterized protein LOC111419361 [Onthophagus taurus]